MADYDQNKVDLKWEPPKSDGGAPIQKYIIEKKDKYGGWDKACEVPASRTSCSVPDLIEGETYEFRVRAVNPAGPGLPSNTTPPVTVKPRNMPPKIDRTNLNPVRIKAGQSFNFDVNISGEPVPDKKWQLKKKDIKPSGAILIKYSDYNTKLRVSGASREESGTYTIMAENCNGKDSADVEVIVLGEWRRAPALAHAHDSSTLLRTKIRTYIHAYLHLHICININIPLYIHIYI